MRLPLRAFGRPRQPVADVALVVGRDALEPADRHRLFLDAAAAAGRLAGPVAGAAEDAREDVGFPVDHERVGVAASGDQPDVFRHGGVGRARPLAIDHLMEVVGVTDVGRLQVGLLSLGTHAYRRVAFLAAVPLCGSGLLPSMTLGETHRVFNRSGRMAGPRGFAPNPTRGSASGLRQGRSPWNPSLQYGIPKAPPLVGVPGATPPGGFQGSALNPYGRIVNADGPGVRSGAARLANSHSRRRVSRGSITSSTQKVSAVR